MVLDETSRMFEIPPSNLVSRDSTWESFRYTCPPVAELESFLTGEDVEDVVVLDVDVFLEWPCCCALTEREELDDVESLRSAAAAVLSGDPAREELVEESDNLAGLVLDRGDCLVVISEDLMMVEDDVSLSRPRLMASSRGSCFPVSG